VTERQNFFFNYYGKQGCLK